MLTPSSSPTTMVLAIPAAFMAAPPTAPAALAEKMKLSRRGYAPRLGLSPRNWIMPPGHGEGDVAPRRARPPPTALYSIRRDSPPPAHSPLHSTGPSWTSGSGGDESCLASGLLASQHATTSPARGGSAGRRWRSSTRLGAVRNAHDADDGEGSDGEETGGARNSARPAMSREHQNYGGSIPASRRQPPEDDDIWSKHSVFEFKSLNDPDTNACGYKGLSGQPRERRGRGTTVAPELRLTSAQQPRQAGTIFDGVEELLAGERPTSPLDDSEAAGTAASINDDLFRFREKGPLAGPNRGREVERRRRGPAGGGRGGGGGAANAVKVELATQLGVPATSTYEELRTAYRVEIKRCHPDLAGDNEFRVKFLERKFQKLQRCWDEFNAQKTAGATAAEAEADGQTDRVWARAQEEARERQKSAVAAAGAAHRSRRPVMDPGRTVLDNGNASSC